MLRWQDFKSFVLVVEGGRLPEIELLSIIAFYDEPVIVGGDQQQLRPYSGFTFPAKNAVQSLNPFARQMTYSTLERPVDAVFVNSYLTFNHRAYAQLSTVPQKVIYRSAMGQG